MDFEKLIEKLPKPSSTWTVKDTEIWLQFIGLDALIPKFQAHSIDGSCLTQLTPEDFQNELKIESQIIIKKIMIWVTTGIPKFDQQLHQSKNLSATSKNREIRIPKQQFKFEQQLLFHKNSSSPKAIQMKPQLKRQKTQSQLKKQQDNQLIIRQCDVQQAANFSLKGAGGMIGRHSTNQILILDEYVSRFHAQIQFDKGQFYIRDCGSISGTFIRITEKIQLKQDMIIELGSNQFQFDLRNSQHIFLQVIQGVNVNQTFKISKKSKSTIGRKSTNDISFPDDQHLSNIHTTVFPVEGILYIEDLGTTNGTWIRLSIQGEKSDRYLLEDKTQFKLSTNLTYQCRRNKANRKTMKQKTEKCSYCGVADKNAIIIPCKHNIGCFQCMTSMNCQKCDSCGSGITDIIKIFTV